MVGQHERLGERRERLGERRGRLVREGRDRLAVDRQRLLAASLCPQVAPEPLERDRRGLGVLGRVDLRDQQPAERDRAVAVARAVRVRGSVADDLEAVEPGLGLRFGRHAVPDLEDALGLEPGFA